MEKFVVRYYAGEKRPVVKGNGFDGLEIGESRDEAEQFINFVNGLSNLPSDAAIKACALMIYGNCLTRSKETWLEDIEKRIRWMLFKDSAIPSKD